MGDIHVNTAETVSADSRPGKKRKIVIITIIVTLLIGILCFAGYEVNKIIEHKKWIEHMTEVVDVPVIYEGIWVDDIHLGGMSIEEAKSV